MSQLNEINENLIKIQKQNAMNRVIAFAENCMPKEKPLTEAELVQIDLNIYNR